MRSALFALCLFLPAAATAQEPTWITDFEAAKAAAKKENKVILADFTGSDWCGWCIKLKNEVFDTPEFKTWAADKVVLLELDFPKQKQLDEALQKQNRALAQQFGVRGYPTVLFLDAAGKQLGKTGYVKGGPAAWIQSAEAAMKTAKPAADGDAAGGEAWLTDYKAALAKAKKEKKVVLADFTGSDWCGWCIKLKNEVFDTPEFQKWAADNVVLLELDFPRQKPQSDELKQQNEKLAKEFGIRGYPTILLLDAKGKKIGQMGYEKGGPANWIEKCKAQIGKK